MEVKYLKTVLSNSVTPSLLTILKQIHTYSRYWLPIEFERMEPPTTLPVKQDASTVSRCDRANCTGDGGCSSGHFAVDNLETDHMEKDVRKRPCDQDSIVGSSHKFRPTMPAVIEAGTVAQEMSMEHQLLYVTLTRALLGQDVSKQNVSAKI